MLKIKRSALLLFAILVNSVSCTNLPKRNFVTILWEAEIYPVCVLRMDDNDITITKCADEVPKDLRLITIDDYLRERDFQDDLIKACN